MSKIIIIAIICIFLSTSIKKYNAEISNIINICGGVLIFLLCVDKLKDVLKYFTEIYNFTDINFDFLSLIFKVLGVGYITEFTADIAEDFGNNIVASKVILGGKIIVCTMTIPIIKNLLSILLSLLS